MQRKLLGEEVTVLKSADTGYTIIVDYEDSRLTPTCQDRTVIVKPVDDLKEIPGCIAHLSGNLQTAGLAIPSDTLLAHCQELGAAGVTNFKIIGTEYTLNISEPHDGIFDTVQLFMSDRLRWSSIGFSDTDQAIEGAKKLKTSSLEALSNL